MATKNEKRDLAYVVYIFFIAAFLTSIVLISIFAGGKTHCATFFDARVVGPYINHYNGQMQCAYVSGWHRGDKCLCKLTNNIGSNNIVLMPPQNSKMCEE